MGGSFSSSSSSSKKSHNNNNNNKNKNKNISISPVDRAVLDLKVTRDRLTKYKRKLEAEETRLLERVRACKRRGQTTAALHLLRLKTHKRAEADRVDQQLLTVMALVQTIDSKQNEQDLIQSLQVGKDALAQLQKQTTVEDVVELMDEIAEQNQTEQEMADIMQQRIPHGILTLQQEQQVEQELETLIMQMEQESTTTTTTTTTTTELPLAPDTELPQVMPAVPTNELSLTQQQEEEGSKKVAVAS